MILEVCNLVRIFIIFRKRAFCVVVQNRLYQIDFFLKPLALACHLKGLFGLHHEKPHFIEFDCCLMGPV